MKRKYHTVEELREAANERARRWREKNRRTHRERVKELYGRSLAQRAGSEGVTEAELERYAKKVGGGPVVEERREVQETVHVSIDDMEGDERVMREHREMMERRRGIKQVPVDAGPQMEPEIKGGHQEEHRLEVELQQKLEQMVERQKVREELEQMEIEV